MKKLFAVCTLVFGIAVFAQAQGTTTPQGEPKKDRSQITEAPKPSASGLKAGTPGTPVTNQSESQIKSTDTRTQVLTPSNKVSVTGTAPVENTRPVVKVSTPVVRPEKQ